MSSDVFVLVVRSARSGREGPGIRKEKGNVAKEFMNFFFFCVVCCVWGVDSFVVLFCILSKNTQIPRQNFRRRERIQKMLHTFCARAANRTVVVGKNVSSGGGRTTSRSTTTSSSSAVWVRAGQRRISPSSWSSKREHFAAVFDGCRSRTSTTSNNGDEESETRKQSSHR